MATEQIVVEIVLDDGSIRRGLLSVEKQAKKSGKAIQRSFSAKLLGSFTAGIGRLTTSLVGLGAAFIAAFAGFRVIGGAISDLNDFTKAFAEIKTIIPDVKDANDKLRDSFILSSAQFGTTAAAQAQSFYQIISAGITDVSRANNTLIASNKLAIGGLATTAESIDILTTTLNAYEKSNLTASRAADILFGTVRLGKVRVTDLASSLGLILPVASEIGVKFVEVSGAVARLTQKGLTAAVAVTQLNAVFTAVLKKQEQAKKIFGETQTVFTSQALAAKGLTVFLRDLTDALGGSKENLTKLLGRVEGVKAIVSLGADGFKGLEDNIRQLTNSTGAADRAFRIIEQTIDQQTKVLNSLKNALFLKFNIEGADFLLSALLTINNALANILVTFEETTASIGRQFKALAITSLAFLGVFKVLPLIIGFFRLLGAQAFIFGTRLRLGAALGLGAMTTLKFAILDTSAAMKALTIATRLFKAIISVGLFIAIDLIIMEFIRLQDVTKTTGEAFKALGLKFKIFFFEVIRDLIGKLAFSFGALFQKIGVDLPAAFEQASLLIGGFKAELEALAPSARLAGETVEEALARINAAIAAAKAKADAGDILAKMVAKLKARTDQIKSVLKSGLEAGVSNAVARMGASLVNGGKAFDNFGAAILGIMGDIAIQVGTIILGMGDAVTALAASLASLNGAPAIAAGLTLIALGGALKAIGGNSGGASAIGNPAGVGGVDPGPTETGDISGDDITDKTTQVQITVEGTVLDPISVGMQISEVLQEAFDATGVEVVRA